MTHATFRCEACGMSGLYSLPLRVEGCDRRFSQGPREPDVLCGGALVRVWTAPSIGRVPGAGGSPSRVAGR